MRIEYKSPQSPSTHRSALSRDEWDCKEKRRATVGTFFFKWNNLQDEDPERSTALFKTWEASETGTLAQTLLEFACGMTPTQELVDPRAGSPGGDPGR
jgi:hypothetical protein